MRAYDLGAASLALGISRKKLDNLLSRHRIPGVARVGRGVTRRLPPEAVVVIAVAQTLVDQLGTAEREAIALAIDLTRAATHRVERPGGLAISCDVEPIARRMEERLASAVEMVVEPRRGRRPGSGRRTGRLE